VQAAAARVVAKEARWEGCWAATRAAVQAAVRVVAKEARREGCCTGSLYKKTRRSTQHRLYKKTRLGSRPPSGTTGSCATCPVPATARYESRRTSGSGGVPPRASRNTRFNWPF